MLEGALTRVTFLSLQHPPAARQRSTPPGSTVDTRINKHIIINAKTRSASLTFSIPINQNSYVADAAAPWGDVASTALFGMVVELDDLGVLPKRAARVLGLVHRAAEEVLLV